MNFAIIITVYMTISNVGKKYCIQQEPECIMIIIIDIIVIIKRAYINMTTFTQVEQKQSE